VDKGNDSSDPLENHLLWSDCLRSYPHLWIQHYFLPCGIYTMLSVFSVIAWKQWKALGLGF